MLQVIYVNKIKLLILKKITSKIYNKLLKDQSCKAMNEKILEYSNFSKEKKNIPKTFL